MKKPFVYIALPLAVLACFTLWLGTKTDLIPLLALLFLSEFGFLVCALGTYTGLRDLKTKGGGLMLKIAVIVSTLMAVGFMLSGFVLWPAAMGNA